jgi:FkbM family methyltransferase
MPAPQRPIAYVLAATNHGSMIVNRNDHHEVRPDAAYGVGFQLLRGSSFDPSEVDLVLQLLTLRREIHGDGLVTIDGGANIGVHTIEWARHMHGWGRVIAFEAQEFVYYALAGNIALNNCFNASARLMALGAAPGEILVPEPDYHRPGSFGSLELRPASGNEFIGQRISYDAADCVRTPMTSIDTLALERLDFLKLDVEGMELEVLRGARATLQKYKPILLVEILKSDQPSLVGFLQELGYEAQALGLNALAVHRDDPCRKRVEFAPPPGQAS